MSPYIKIISENIVRIYMKNRISDENYLLEKIKDELFNIKSEKDKLDFLTIILEANEKLYEKHLKECTRKSNCDFKNLPVFLKIFRWRGKSSNFFKKI